ncbi:hypothetical protein HZC31_02470 [Candidatus Woesearchaeota archaeon]|nr:hypothetical protein [Candidatus Woesearchaeota archaeon]
MAKFDDQKIITPLWGNLSDKFLLNENSPLKESNFPTPRYNAPLPRSEEAEYQRMKRVAVEEDDFRRVLDVYSAILKRSPSVHGEATRVLREAFALYGTTQQQVADIFAGQGDFEETDTHIKNACSSYTVRIDFSEVTLEPAIENGKLEEIVNKAVEKTPSAHFIEKAMKAADAGDTKEAAKYSGLSFRALRVKGTRQFCREIGVTLDDEDDYAYAPVKIGKTIKRLHQKVYRVALQRKGEEAIGYAVDRSLTSSSEISRLRGVVAELVLEYWDIFVNTPPGKDSGITAFLNGAAHPVFDTLVDVAQDKNHPLRIIYKAKREQPYAWSKIVGCERVEVPQTQVVPRAFYEQAYQQTGIPILVHPFFNRIAQRYGWQV